MTDRFAKYKNRVLEPIKDDSESSNDRFSKYSNWHNAKLGDDSVSVTPKDVKGIKRLGTQIKDEYHGVLQDVEEGRQQSFLNEVNPRSTETLEDIKKTRRQYADELGKQNSEAPSLFSGGSEGGFGRSAFAQGLKEDALGVTETAGSLLAKSPDPMNAAIGTLVRGSAGRQIQRIEEKEQSEQDLGNTQYTLGPGKVAPALIPLGGVSTKAAGVVAKDTPLLQKAGKAIIGIFKSSADASAAQAVISFASPRGDIEVPVDESLLARFIRAKEDAMSTFLVTSGVQGVVAPLAYGMKEAGQFIRNSLSPKRAEQQAEQKVAGNFLEQAPDQNKLLSTIDANLKKQYPPGYQPMLAEASDDTTGALMQMHSRQTDAAQFNPRQEANKKAGKELWQSLNKNSPTGVVREDMLMTAESKRVATEGMLSELEDDVILNANKESDLFSRLKDYDGAEASKQAHNAAMELHDDITKTKNAKYDEVLSNTTNVVDVNDIRQMVGDLSATGFDTRILKGSGSLQVLLKKGKEVTSIKELNQAIRELDGEIFRAKVDKDGNAVKLLSTVNSALEKKFRGELAKDPPLLKKFEEAESYFVDEHAKRYGKLKSTQDSLYETAGTRYVKAMQDGKIEGPEMLKTFFFSKSKTPREDAAAFKRIMPSEAMANHFAETHFISDMTKALEKSSDRPKAFANYMRDNNEALREFPEVTQQLNNIGSHLTDASVTDDMFNALRKQGERELKGIGTELKASLLRRSLTIRDMPLSSVIGKAFSRSDKKMMDELRTIAAKSPEHREAIRQSIWEALDSKFITPSKAPITEARGVQYELESAALESALDPRSPNHAFIKEMFGEEDFNTLSEVMRISKEINYGETGRVTSAKGTSNTAVNSRAVQALIGNVFRVVTGDWKTGLEVKVIMELLSKVAQNPNIEKTAHRMVMEPEYAYQALKNEKIRLDDLRELSNRVKLNKSSFIAQEELRREFNNEIEKETQ